MWSKIKDAWFIWVVIILAVVLIAYAIWTTQTQRPTAPAVEEVVEEVTEAGEASPSGEVRIFEDSEVEISDTTLGDTVIATRVLLSVPGYVVIHEDADGKPGAIIGASDLLPKGESEGMVVELDRPTEEGEVLYAMLHFDDGDLEFDAASDDPIIDEEGNIVLMKFVIIEQPAEIGEEEATPAAEEETPAELTEEQ
ncbi:hypothetical protein IH980_04955 [Patescibacteria group bacterium]|nr:hypothetical protein [Patescibacteria group bacterium]